MQTCRNSRVRHHACVPKSSHIPGALCTALQTSWHDGDRSPSNSSSLSDLLLINRTLIQHNTDLLLTQLLHAFSPPGKPGNLSEAPSPDPENGDTKRIFAFLCSHLNCPVLDALQLNSTRVKESVCAVAGLPANTTTIWSSALGPSAQDNSTIPVVQSSGTAGAYISARSQLLGTLIGVTARSSAEADAMCNTPANNATANATILTTPKSFPPLGLDPGTVNAVLCGNTFDGFIDPVPLWGAAVSDAVMSRALQANSGVFLGVMQDVGTYGEFPSFLCDHMDEAGLNSTNLNGFYVLDGLCHMIR